MFSIICFILPILLWLLTFPIKIVIHSLELSLKAKEFNERRQEKRENGGSRSLLTRLEDWADTDDNNFELEKNIARKTGKAVKGTGKLVISMPGKVNRAVKRSTKLVKATKKVVKGTVKVTRQAIKLTIKALKLIISLIRWIISGLLAMGLVGIIILIVIILVLVGSVAIVVINSSVSEVLAEGNSSSSNTSTGGVAYLSIDWSQDFSAKLQEIESTYGAKNRHHAELVILNCRTLQSNSDIILDPSTWIGIKKIETRTDVFQNSNPSYSVFDSYADIYAYNNGYNCYGAFQINVSNSLHAWTLYNKDYQAKKGTPYGGSRDTTYGNIYFYPDLCLGTNKAYSESIVDWSSNKAGSRGYNGVLDDLKQCFSDLGVEYTDERGKKVLEFFLANSYNLGTLKRLSGDTYNAIAKLYIEFFNTYGWERNDAQIEMIKSTVNAGQENNNIYVVADARDWVWGGSASNFDSSVSCGLLDANGNPISKSVYGYLSDGNQSLKSAISSNFPGKTGINEAQLYYGIAVYFVGTWEIEKTIDYLDIRDQMSDSSGGGLEVNGDYSNKIMQIAERESKSQKIKYSMPNRIFENYADCSSLIDRVLCEAGVNAFGNDASNFKGYKTSQAFTGNAPNTTSQMNWVRKNQPDAIVWTSSQGTIDYDKLQVGDVLVHGEHTAFYMGKSSDGKYLKFHASSGNPSQFSCYETKELTGSKHGFGWGQLGSYDSNRWEMAYRPSLFK